MKMFKNYFILSLLCANLFFLHSCSGAQISKEDEIRQYIEQGVQAAENRSAGDLADMIDNKYHDEKGLNKQHIKKLLRAYFFTHKNIFLFTKIREIKFRSQHEASVDLHVAMAGSVIADASVLSSLRARMYKFELHLVKRDEWLLQNAKWQAVSRID